MGSTLMALHRRAVFGHVHHVRPDPIPALEHRLDLADLGARRQHPYLDHPRLTRVGHQSRHGRSRYAQFPSDRLHRGVLEVVALGSPNCIFHSRVVVLSHAEPSLLHVWLCCTIVHILRATLHSIASATRVAVIRLARSGAGRSVHGQRPTMRADPLALPLSLCLPAPTATRDRRRGRRWSRKASPGNRRPLLALPPPDRSRAPCPFDAVSPGGRPAEGEQVIGCGGSCIVAPDTEAT